MRRHRRPPAAVGRGGASSHEPAPGVPRLQLPTAAPAPVPAWDLVAGRGSRGGQQQRGLLGQRREPPGAPGGFGRGATSTSHERRMSRQGAASHQILPASPLCVLCPGVGSCSTLPLPRLRCPFAACRGQSCDEFDASPMAARRSEGGGAGTPVHRRPRAASGGRAGTMLEPAAGPCTDGFIPCWLFIAGGGCQC